VGNNDEMDHDFLRWQMIDKVVTYVSIIILGGLLWLIMRVYSIDEWPANLCGFVLIVLIWRGMNRLDMIDNDTNHYTSMYMHRRIVNQLAA